MVVALGGNALSGRASAGRRRSSSRRCARPARRSRRSFAEDQVVVTHGNGPQVGNELLRQERAADEVPPLPLYLAVAQTQAEIGAMIETELAGRSGRAVACLITHVPSTPRRRGVRAADEADRPVLLGRAGSSARAGARLAARRGRGPGLSARRPLAASARDRGAGLDPARWSEPGTIAVACGGGGIPVVSRNGI